MPVRSWRSPVALLRAIVGAISLLAFGAAAHGADGFHYHYFKQRVELAIDETRVAVLASEEAGPAEVNGALSRSGVARSGAEPWPIDGWMLAGASADQRAGRSIEHVVRDLPSDEAVEFASPVFFGADGGPIIVTPDILVRFREGVDEGRIDQLIGAHAPNAQREKGWGGMSGSYRLTTRYSNGFDVLDAANALAVLPEVEYAEPDVIFTGRGSLTPNDPLFPDCWGLRNTGQFGGVSDQDMDADQAWDITTGSASIIVCIIDTGVDQAHPDINQITPGADFTTDNGDGGPVNSFDNHGTPVAGCVSATINNSLGTVGVAPGCRVISARPFVTVSSNGNWTSQASWTVDALDFAQTQGCRVTNNSNGYGFTSSSIATKYSATRSAGIIHFASAGNDNGGTVTYPANLSVVNAISALDPDGLIASFSNVGPEITLSAPGSSIRTTDRTGAAGWSGGDYTFANGTSFASPYCAGVAALALSLNSGFTVNDLESLLYSTAVDRGPPGFDNTYGHGFINAHQALLSVAPPGAFVLVAPASGATGVSTSPLFQWTTAVGASNYTIQVDDDSDFSSPVIDLTTGLTSYQPPAFTLDMGTPYHWKVVANNGVGSTASTPASAMFTTDGPLPEMPVLVSPSGTTVDTTAPEFQFSRADFANEYLLEVDDDPGFATPEISDTVAQPSGEPDFVFHTPSAGLLMDAQTYHWRVTAINFVGEAGSLPASASFDVLLPAPCEGDVNGDDSVDTNDIGYTIFRLGDSGPPGEVEGDADGNGAVETIDLGYIIFRLGPCP